MPVEIHNEQRQAWHHQWKESARCRLYLAMVSGVLKARLYGRG